MIKQEVISKYNKITLINLDFYLLVSVSSFALTLSCFDKSVNKL